MPEEELQHDVRFVQRWPALLSRKAAAEYLMVSERTIVNMSDPRTGVLKPVLVRGMIRYRRPDLDVWIESLPEANTRERANSRARKTETARMARQS